MNASTVSIVVAGCALLFTIGAFWWINVRRGRLRAYPPSSFVYYAARDRTRLRLPVLLCNTGAAPIVVLDLRAQLPDVPGGTHWPWVATFSDLQPLSTNTKWFPSIFAVQGRAAVQLFLEFGRADPAYIPTPGAHRVVIEARLGHTKAWRRLLEFKLNTARVTNSVQYIAQSNGAGHYEDKSVVPAQAMTREALDDQEASEPVSEAT